MASVTEKLIVSGRVQGVGFRSFVSRVARQYGVDGWVKNLVDGTVEIVAQCDANTLSEFIRAVETGNSFARVTHIHRTTVSPTEQLAGFEIRF